MSKLKATKENQPLNKPRQVKSAVKKDVSAADTETASIPSSEEMLQHIWDEMGKESVDRRRVLMLKAQLAQTERQLLVQNDALMRRREVLMMLDDDLQKLSQLSREGVSKSGAGAEVSVKRATLVQLVESCKRARGTLRKHVDCSLSDEFYNSALLPNKFMRKKEDAFGGGRGGGGGGLREMAAAMIRGDTAQALCFLNLRRVEALETRLADLYSHMVELQVWLGLGGTPAYCSDQFRTGYTAALEKSSMQVDAVCAELLELSLLLPVYPGAGAGAGLRGRLQSNSAAAEVRRILHKELGQESRLAVEARIRALEAEAAAGKQEAQVLRAQLQEQSRGQRGLAELSEAACRGLAQGQAQLMGQFRAEVRPPLTQLLASFDRLEAHPSPDCLKLFLEECRACVPQLRRLLREQGETEVRAEDAQPDPQQVELLRVKLAELIRS